MALAMVFAATTFVVGEADASVEYSESAIISDDGSTITVDNYSDFNIAMKTDTNITKIVLSEDVTIPDGNNN